jgi:hypothetical protein
MGFSCLRFLSRLAKAGLGIVPFRRTLRHLRPYTFKQAIAFRGLSCFAEARALDRVEKVGQPILAAAAFQAALAGQSPASPKGGRS